MGNAGGSLQFGPDKDEEDEGDGERGVREGLRGEDGFRGVEGTLDSR